MNASYRWWYFPLHLLETCQKVPCMVCLDDDLNDINFIFLVNFESISLYGSLCAFYAFQSWLHHIENQNMQIRLFCEHQIAKLIACKVNVKQFAYVLIFTISWLSNICIIVFEVHMQKISFLFFCYLQVSVYFLSLR